MADLDAAIRAKLAGWGDDPCGYGTCIVIGWSELKSAVLAVLELHAPIGKGKHAYCECQIDDGAIWERYPCDAVKTIAKALGIEVADA